MPQSPGSFIIRDIRTGVEIHLPAQSAADATAWLKLMERRPPVTSLHWDEARQEWVPYGNNT